MTKYKIVKIWFVEADDKEQALSNMKEPTFVSVNDNYRVGEEKLKGE